MANSSEKKIAKARSEANKFYLPFWVIAELLHVIMYFLWPLVSPSDEESTANSRLTLWNLGRSLALSSMSATAYFGILSAVDESISGGASSEKWSAKDADGNPVARKTVAGSSSIDAFFLSLAIKVAATFSEACWYGTLAVPAFFAWKAYGIFALTKGAISLFTGGAKKKNEAEAPAKEETPEERERREKRAEKRRQKGSRG
jgi:hypothetical protein